MATSVFESPALDDLVEIARTHVELSPEEAVILEKKLPNLMAALRPEVRKALEAEYTKKLVEFQEQLTTSNKEMITAELEKYKASLEPLSKDDISQLLNQEYTDFTFPVKLANPKEGETAERSFVIRELPQAVETRFLTLLQAKLIPVLQTVQAVDWSLDGTMVDKIKNTLDGIPGLLEVASQCVMISLDPYGRDNITQSWVKDNLSSYRMSIVILAQVEANRYRDFFSNGFRLSKNLKRNR